MGNNYTMVAKTLFGFEELLEEELRNLGAINVQKGVRSVTFEGDKGFMYKANLCLRTAIKILKPVKSFRVRNEQDLYDQIYKMDWERFMSVHSTFAIDATLATDRFHHSQFISLKTKDAIVDKFRNLHGTRPDVDLKYPDIRIHIHIQQSEVTVSIDSSGRSLHQRGYKTATNIAPINEVLAAGLIMMSGWDGQCDFMDPMCGSGTIPVEAAMIACNIPPNINRKEFAFEKWPDFDANLFEKIIESSLKKTREFHHKIYGYDKAPSAVAKAKDNVKNANLSEYITITQRNFFETYKPVDGKLHMVFNPPYGERLSIDMEQFYKSIGDTLKKHYPGTDAWFITSNMEALKHVGLRPSRKIKLFNGHLESRLVKYEMYEGSKKGKYIE
ncbi:THUMP domain-containing class I SAM-dependent RNA methyltransferase [Imtechella halotolerans]|uniref:Putative N6-adenine-specific DNA methylase n=1 Tax=Imtechella halotolerans K1 TaxID=946077 RepID=I0WFH9_9FLAO|nr:class I SAM-dependent RNA methyltransferase [Imtechella halotolerans]EID75145.1 putative N6-adenine-specific DNA methylase [Imtechella halotolerans K1]WMQ62218.1 class I SAM-dependent RNA methyltransferase [Imtechella halotolerans]